MPSLNTGNAILSNAIAVDSSYNVGIGGAASGSFKLQVTGNVNADNFIIQPTGYGLLASLSRDLTGSGFGVLNLRNGSNGFIQPAALSVDRTYTLPDATGTIALTSNLSAYLPLTGGTLTGALGGTSAVFSSTIFMGSGSQVMTNGLLKLGIASGNAGAALQLLGWSGGTNWQIDTAYIGNGFNITPSTTSGGTTFTTPAFSISNIGNVGIGIISPASSFGFARTLVISNPSNAEISLEATTSGKVFSIGVTNGYNYFQTSSGNGYDFQIGTSSRFKITPDANFDYGGFNIQSSNNNTYRQAFYGALSLMWRNGGDWYLNSNHTYSISNTNVASFSTANGIGRLGVSGGDFEWGTFDGSVTAGSSYAISTKFFISKLGQISSTATLADWSHVISNQNASSPNGLIIQYTGANKNNTANQFLYCTDNFGATLRMEVRSNGGLANYQANDVNLSDERTKKDIILLESYWDKFKAIEIVKFKYKDQTHDDFNIGVIAQQVEKIAPEFVDVDGWDTKPKINKDDNEIVSNEEPLKSIYTSDLHHATIKVLQEAMLRIEEQQSQIEAQQQQINSLINR
jgi:hypothetical protein